ncbi:hypothetical protein NX02_10135 [Sphingomonas sanxanigenens DSM 19645 = NX02]|uniref:Uncharacterized protein n=1 Tax=Sphingomonas sanxanigenens DSM 19645 = NX02 TaxID=1123269 RepID=W0A732_9SPHN|nr:hypothetical protein NX02_10135 [Sphingomonas sanxanigenens DSM 19645 = NX02]
MPPGSDDDLRQILTAIRSDEQQYGSRNRRRRLRIHLGMPIIRMLSRKLVLRQWAPKHVAVTALAADAMKA